MKLTFAKGAALEDPSGLFNSSLEVNTRRAIDFHEGELYHPVGLEESSGEPLRTHVRTPSGAQVELRSAELQREVAERFGDSVELMQLKHGIFDDASVSVISLATIAGISRDVGADLDRRRFRANIVLDTRNAEPFLEDAWVGGTLLFGDSEPGPAVSVTARDVRCMMINLDPDTGKQDSRFMKTVERLNKNNAGVRLCRPGRFVLGSQ